MHSLACTVSVRLVCSAVTLLSLAACTGATTISPADAPADASVPAVLPTELAFTSVLARPPMQDMARAAGVAGGVAVAGLLNQTPPCFTLTSAATRTGARVVVRMTARETMGTCATFAAGAFDYDVGVKGLSPGAYDVEVVHRVELKDGRVVEAKATEGRVTVTAG